MRAMTLWCLLLTNAVSGWEFGFAPSAQASFNLFGRAAAGVACPDFPGIA